MSALISEVVDGEDVGVVPKSPHGLGLSGNADTGGRVQPLGLDDGQGYVSVEDGVVGPVDALLTSLAEEVLDLIAAVGEGGGLRGVYDRGALSGTPSNGGIS